MIAEDKTPLDSQDPTELDPVLEGDPARDVPKTEGPLFQAMGINIELRSEPQYEVHFRVPSDVVTFNISPVPGIQAAFDSDRIARTDLDPVRMHFHPAGSEVYGLNRNTTAGITCVLEVDPVIRRSLEAEMKGPPPDLRVMLNIGSSQVSALSHTVHDFMRSGYPGGKLVADAIAVLAVTESLMALGADVSTVSASPATLGRRTLERTREYVETHLHEDIRLNDLAAVACLSPHHFSRVFKTTTGRPPTVYLLERRIERAKQLLQTTDDTLSAIAFQCGFSSQSHMTTAFRRLLGITPAKVRKEGGR